MRRRRTGWISGVVRWWWTRWEDFGRASRGVPLTPPRGRAEER